MGGEVIPDGRLGNGTRVYEAEAAIGAVGAIAKAVDAERAGVLASGHAHPRGDGDGWDDALEASPRARTHQAVKILEAPVAEDNFRRGAVKAQNADFRMRIVSHVDAILASAQGNFCAGRKVAPRAAFLPGKPRMSLLKGRRVSLTSHRACIIDVGISFSTKFP